MATYARFGIPSIVSSVVDSAKITDINSVYRLCVGHGAPSARPIMGSNKFQPTASVHYLVGVYCFRRTKYNKYTMIHYDTLWVWEKRGAH